MVCVGARRAVALGRNIDMRCDVVEEKTHVVLIHAEARTPSSSTSAKEVVHAESRTFSLPQAQSAIREYSIHADCPHAA